MSVASPPTSRVPAYPPASIAMMTTTAATKGHQATRAGASEACGVDATASCGGGPVISVGSIPPRSAGYPVICMRHVALRRCRNAAKGNHSPQLQPRLVMRLADVDYRHNSIGFLRLFFAALVIFSHGYGLGGFNPADEPIVHLSKGEWSLGTIAVCGFFFLSGFLVTKSYDGLQSLSHFIWHRVLRIFPGYWCCLVVTAFAFAPLLYYFGHHSLTGFFDLSARDSAIGFLPHNYALDMYQFDVMGVTKTNPFSLGLNGSLWTLGNEFRCYLVLAILGVTGILIRKPVVVLAILAALWAMSISPAVGTALITKHPTLFAIFEQSYQFEEMFVYFFLGAAAYLYRERIPVRTLPFVIAAAGVIAVLPWPGFRAVMPLLLGYSIVWLICKLPLRSIDRRFDLSYGVYIYAFPVQQALTFFGLGRFGLCRSR